MLFSSYEFLFVFLPLVLLGFYVLLALRASLIPFFLILVSLYFYAAWHPHHGVLLAGLMVLTYMTGQLISSSSSPMVKRLSLIVGIIANLSALAWFKYSGFLVNNLNQIFPFETNFIAPVLPLAISFFVFQKIAYLVDKYRGKIGNVTIREFILFVTFFPQLIAGPISHFNEIGLQFRKSEWTSRAIKSLPIAVTFFSIGLFKKVFIADTIAGYINEFYTYAQHVGTLDMARSWVAALGYTAQIYFDFSGYSDMAIGLGLFFGIYLPINFLSPYKSVSIIDFWRRWHITLSRFLAEYLYVSLGGNRKGVIRRFINIMTVMLLGGLWHGAQWTFVFWGGLHGLYLIVNHGWRLLTGYIPTTERSSSAKFLSWLLTFIAVVVAWVFFRAPDFKTAITVLQGMFGLHGFIDMTSVASQAAWSGVTEGQFLQSLMSTWIFVTIALLVTFLLPNIVEFTGYDPKNERTALFEGRSVSITPVFRRGFVAASSGLALALAIWTVLAGQPSEFIYFRF